MGKDFSLLFKNIDLKETVKGLIECGNKYFNKRKELEDVIEKEDYYKKEEISSLNAERIDNEKKIQAIYDDNDEMDKELFETAKKCVLDSQNEENKIEWFDRLQHVASECKKK